MTIQEWRAFIGPRYEPASAAYRHEWWTPGNLTDTAELDTTLADGATTIVLATAGSLDTRGGAWIGPNGTGQAWEYITYTGKTATDLTGITREAGATREHNGIHTAGAIVRQWWEITDDNGTLRLTEELSESLAAITWTAAIEGIKAPPPPLRPDHVVVIQTRETGGAWSTYLVGFVRGPKIRDDYQRLRQWSIEITSIAGILASQQAPGIKVGEYNLARYGSATSDTELADPRKEQMSGDFVGSSPDLAAKSAIDDDSDTLWIAERFVGTPADYTPIPGTDGDNAYEKVFLTQARINRWPGEGAKSRWLEFCVKGQTFPALALMTSDWTNTVSVGRLTGWSSSTGDTVIFCEDESTFRALNPHAEPTKLVQVGSLFFDSLDVASDAVGFWNLTAGSVFSAAYSWGGNNRIDYTFGAGGASPSWLGDPIPAPQPGEIIRYNYDSGATQPADHYIVDYVDMAGYKANDGEDPWLLVTLPRLQLALAANITDSAPGIGAELSLEDSDGNPSTIGLETTGTLQIGTEQITYSARSTGSVTVSARGANSTTAASHLAGDPVRVISSGFATNGRLINRIEWSRTQAPYPEEFRIYRSAYDEQRNPGDDTWASDYTLVADVSAHASADYGIDLSPAVRATAVLILVDKMSADPARVRINDLRVIGSTAEYPSGIAIAASDTDDVIAAILTAAGANVGITNTGPSTQINKVTTETGAAWAVAADMADYGGCILDCTRTGPITVAANPLRAGTLTPAATIDEDEIAALEYAQPPYTPVHYIRLPWRDPEGDDQDPVEYPASHPTSAVPIDLEPAAFEGSAEATAAATRRYGLLRYPTIFVAQLATPQPYSLRPGAVLTLGWSLEQGTQDIARTVIVTSVDNELSAHRWTTVLQLRQIDREAAG